MKVIPGILILVLFALVIAGPVQAVTSPTFLCHMNGTNDGTTFTDEKGKSISRYGDTVTKTGTKYLGTASGYFDGTGDYLTVPDSSDWYLGTGDFTILLWVRSSDLSTRRMILTQYSADSNWWGVYYHPSDGYSFSISAGGGGVDVSDGTISGYSTDTWHQIVVRHTGTTYTIYLDGSVAGSVTDSDGVPDIASTLYLGKGPIAGTYYQWYGYLDEVAIWKGTAVNIGDLYPQSSELDIVVPTPTPTPIPTEPTVGAPTIGTTSPNVVNLSQDYMSQIYNTQQYEDLGSDWSTAEDNAAIVNFRIQESATNNVIHFVATTNNQRQIPGTVTYQDTTPISSTMTLSLGTVTYSNSFVHLPFVGVAPRVALTYGMDSGGYHYLVLLPDERVNGKDYFEIDTTTDANILIDPPLTDPIVNIHTDSTDRVNLWGKAVSMDLLSPDGGLKDDSNQFVDSFWGALGWGTGLFAFLLVNGGTIIPFIPLVFVLGEGYMFLTCIERSRDIGVGIGDFVDKNIEILGKIQGIVGWGIEMFYKVLDFIKFW